MDLPESQDAINQREWESSWNWSPCSGSGFALNLAQPGARTALAAMCVVPVVLGTVLIALYLFG